MKNLKKYIIGFVFFIFSLIFIVIGFLWWNFYPPLPKESFQPITKLKDVNTTLPSFLKVVSYNIHYGIGLDWNRKDKLKKEDFENRLDKIAEILSEINADIVLLQEVDFNSERSQLINQAEYIAKRANYSYFSIAPHIRLKFHPNLQGMSGTISQGLAVLSKYEIKRNESYIFNYPSSVPFYIKWLYFPHGVQKNEIEFGNKTLTIFNVHLEPWCQETREKESLFVKKIINNTKTPIICGGDFNAIPQNTTNKMFFHLNDAPWFINRNKWDYRKDSTILNIQKIATFTEAISDEKFLSDEKSSFTFPSNHPEEKLDYIFAGKNSKIMFGYVYKKAGIISDHLPLIAYIKILEK